MKVSKHVMKKMMMIENELTGKVSSQDINAILDIDFDMYLSDEELMESVWQELEYYGYENPYYGWTMVEA